MKKWKQLSGAKQALCLFYALASIIFCIVGIFGLFTHSGRGGWFLVLSICFLLFLLIHLHRGDDNKSVF